jgi:hypothetical protein
MIPTRYFQLNVQCQGEQLCLRVRVPKANVQGPEVEEQLAVGKIILAHGKVCNHDNQYLEAIVRQGKLLVPYFLFAERVLSQSSQPIAIPKGQPRVPPDHSPETAPLAPVPRAEAQQAYENGEWLRVLELFDSFSQQDLPADAQLLRDMACWYLLRPDKLYGGNSRTKRVLPVSL